MEKILTVSYVAPENGDQACLTVFFVDKEMTIARNAFYGMEAQVIYNRLTGLNLEIKSNVASQENGSWIADMWSKSLISGELRGAQTFVLKKEELEHILKGPAKTGPATLLHNKDCPYGYQCRAMECMECAELYGKDVDHVDGLASDESDTVNTAGEPA
jgi:hypothetical protein